MADRTTQPADGISVNPLYSGATFLWNAIAPNKNQINNATTTLKGNTVAGGADGQYHLFNTTEGQMSFAQSTPSGAYTVVLGLTMPEQTAGAKVFSLGNAVRVEITRSAGGVYITTTHTGVAAATNYVISTTAPNSDMWTLVLRYTGTVLYQYVLNGAGTAEATNTDTIGFSGAQTNVLLGDTIVSSGLYAAAVIPSDVGAAEATALRDNLWRVFAPTGGNPAPTFPGPNIGNLNGTEGVALSANTVSDSFSDTDALTFSAIGSWPPGVTVSSAGVISGTPTTAGTYSALKVRATDTATQTVDSDTFSFTISAAAVDGIITTPALKNNTGTLLASETSITVNVYHATTGALIVQKTGLTSNASGIVVIADALIVAGTSYAYEPVLSGGRRRLPVVAAT